MAFFLAYILSPPLLVASKYVFQTKLEDASALTPCLVTTDTTKQISSAEAAGRLAIQEAIRTNITFLDIIDRLCLKCRPVCVSKHNVSETGFYLLLQVEPIQLGPIDRGIP
jgi:hypothetical protein